MKKLKNKTTGTFLAWGTLVFYLLFGSIAFCGYDYSSFVIGLLFWNSGLLWFNTLLGMRE